MPTIIQSIGVSGDFGSMSLNDPTDGVAISSTGTDGAASDFSLTDLANSIFIKEFQTEQYKIGINKTFDSTQYTMDISGDLRIDTGPSGDRQGGHLRIQPNTQNFPGPNKIVMYEAPFNIGQTPTTSIGIGVDTNTMKFHSTSDYKWYYNASGTWNYIKDASGNNISVGKMPTENGNLAMQLTDNDLSLNGNLNIHGNSVNFSQPSVKFSIDKVFDFSDASCALILPTGTTSDRSLSTSVNGMVRYNYQTKKIEQYIDGWSGLKAAVADVDGDTYISAEEIVGNQPQDNDQLHFYTRGTKRMLIDNDGKIAIGNVSTDPSSNLHIFSGGTFTSNNIPAFGITAMTGSNFSANAGTTFPFMNLQTAAGTDYLRLNVINYNTGVTGTEDQVSFTGFGVSVKDGSNGFIDNAMVVHPKGNVGFGTILPNAKLHVRNTTNNNPNQPAILLEYAGNDNYINLNNISGTSSIHGIKFLKSNTEQFTISGSDTSFNITKGNKTPLFIDLSLNRTGINNSIAPTVSLDISGTDAIRIPIGTSAQRPSATDINEYGLIRYNTTTSSYEGFGAGNAWGSLGGIKDVDQDTYITAENSAGADNDQLKFFTASTEKMIIDSNGNVGIGTNSPSNTLTINGTSSDTVPILGLRSGNAHNVINNGAQIAFAWSNSDDYQHFIHTRHSSTDNNLNAMDFYLCDNTANNTVTSGSNHALTLTGSGRVGVGVTNPTVALDINGSIKFTGDMQVSGGMTSDADYITSSASTSHDVIFKAGTTERFRIKGNGNVGIGTVTPSEKLHLMGDILVEGTGHFTGDTGSVDPNTNDTPGVHIGTSTSGSTKYANIQLVSTAASGSWIDFTTTNDDVDREGRILYNTTTGMIFETDKTERLRINASGNLGIGTDAPTAKLHIKYDGTADTPGIIIENNGSGTGDNDAILELKSQDTGEPGIIFTHQGVRKWQISGGGDTMSNDFFLWDHENNKARLRVDKNNGYIAIADDVTSTSSNVTLSINSSDAIKIPVGTTAQRPSASSASHFGYIRYNSTISSYEGFGAGNAWGSLGGVKDVDQDTYISAETSAGADNDQIKFYSAGIQRMIVDSSGGVAIGKDIPTQTLDVSGNILIDNGGSLLFDSQINIAGPNKIKYIKDDDKRYGVGIFTDEVRHFSQTKSSFYYESGGTVTNPTYYKAMELNQDDLTVEGNISGSTLTAGDLSITTGKIETTNVDISLEPKGSSVSTGSVIVKGDLQIDGSLNLIGQVIRTDTNVKVTDQFEITNDGTGPALKVSQTGTNDIAEFFDDGVSVFKIEDGGNVGISTNNPSEKLHIYSTSDLMVQAENNTANSYVGFKAQGNGGNISITRYNDSYTTSGAQMADSSLISTGTGDANGFNLRSYATDNTAHMRFYTGGNNQRMIITADGKVGIGINNPTHNLHVSGNILSTGTISAAADTDNTSYFGRAAIGYGGWTDQASFSHIDRATTTDYAFLQSSVGKTMFNSSSGQSIVFKHNNDDKMTLTSGNLGIGTDAPAAKLDVTGNIKLSGSLKTSSVELTQTELGYLDGTTSNIQSQLNNLLSGGGSQWTTVNSNEIHYSTGNVGIGTNNPSKDLHIFGSSNTSLKIENANTFNIVKVHRTTSNNELYISEFQIWINGTNVATSGTPSADVNGSYASNAIDNNHNTLYNSAPSTTSTGWQIQLAQSYPLSSIQAIQLWARRDYNLYNRINNFEVIICDNDTIKYRQEITGNNNGNSYTNGGAVVKFTGPDHSNYSGSFATSFSTTQIMDDTAAIVGSTYTISNTPGPSVSIDQSGNNTTFNNMNHTINNQQINNISINVYNKDNNNNSKIYKIPFDKEWDLSNIDHQKKLLLFLL